MGADIKAVRARIKTVEATRHITKAMELVASAKIKKAIEKMESSRRYKAVMMNAFATLAREKSIYTVGRGGRLPALYVVVAGDRGLAGGYNSNIFRSASAMIETGDIVIPIGRRAVEYFSRRGRCHTEEYASSETFSCEEAARLAGYVRDMYVKGDVSSVNIISTKHVSSFTQTPAITYVLPIRAPEGMAAKGDYRAVEFEPSAAEVMEAIIPDYIAGILYSSVSEAFAAELAARRSAMDTATKNADEMKAELSLRYNRARQSAITQEITEIVAGANA